MTRETPHRLRTPMLERQGDVDLEVSNILNKAEPNSDFVAIGLSIANTGMSKDSKKKVVYNTKGPKDYSKKIENSPGRSTKSNNNNIKELNEDLTPLKGRSAN
jgi:hypothetical protein